jgi:hypothetical protein
MQVHLHILVQEIAEELQEKYFNHLVEATIRKMLKF